MSTGIRVSLIPYDYGPQINQSREIYKKEKKINLTLEVSYEDQIEVIH